MVDTEMLTIGPVSSIMLMFAPACFRMAQNGVKFVQTRVFAPHPCIHSWSVKSTVNVYLYHHTPFHSSHVTLHRNGLSRCGHLIDIVVFSPFHFLRGYIC